MRAGVYTLSFVLARGALYGAPLMLANLLRSDEYGALETAQATASLVANAAALGTAGLVPLVLLQHTKNATLAGITLHHLVLAAICIAAALYCWLVGVSLAWPIAAIFTAAIALQTLGSTHLKSLGRSEASVLLDAGLFGLMALAGLCAHWLDSRYAMTFVIAAATGYAMVLMGVYLTVFCRARSANIAGQWWSALGMGWPLMLGGIVSILATTSGRLGIGLLAGPLVAADYAVISRAAALPIVAHQLIMIARFRDLFALPHAQAERAAAQIVALVAVSAFGFWLLCPWFGALLGPAFVDAWVNHRLPGAWIVAQSVLWSAIALNDLVISRQQVMMRVLPFSAAFIVLALGLGWWLLQWLGANLPNFVYVHGMLMLLFYIVQSVAMLDAGIFLWRVWGVAGGSYLLIIGSATARVWLYPAP